MDYLEKKWLNVQPIHPEADCSVCLSKKKKPVILRCGHLFCRKCIERNYKNQRRQFLKEYETGLLAPTCPVCRREIHRFRNWPSSETINTFTRSVVEALEKSDSYCEIILEVNEAQTLTSHQPEIIQIDKSLYVDSEQWIVRATTADLAAPLEITQDRKVVTIANRRNSFLSFILCLIASIYNWINTIHRVSLEILVVTNLHFVLYIMGRHQTWNISRPSPLILFERKWARHFQVDRTEPLLYDVWFTPNVDIIHPRCRLCRGSITNLMSRDQS